MELLSAIAGLLLPFIVIPVFLYALYCIHYFLTQPNLLFRPYKSITIHSPSRDVDHTEFLITTADRVQISAWYIPVCNPIATILFCHGNAGNLTQRIDSFHIFRELSCDVFIFDYRGYGISKGKPTEKGLYKDADAVWNYLVKGIRKSPEEIILFGRSLGGGVASYLAEKYSPAALILESSFTSVPDLVPQVMPFAPKPIKLLTRYKFNTLERMKNIRCPVLVVHSQEDLLIPYHHGITLYEAASQPKYFLQIHGDHTYGFWDSRDIYTQGLKQFFESIKLNTDIPNEEK